MAKRMTSAERQRKIANDAGFTTYYQYRKAVAEAEGFSGYNEKRKVLGAAKKAAGGRRLNQAERETLAGVKTRQGKRATVEGVGVFGRGVEAEIGGAGPGRGSGYAAFIEDLSDVDAERREQGAVWRRALWEASARGRRTGSVYVTYVTEDGDEAGEDSWFDSGDGSYQGIVRAVAFLWEPFGAAASSEPTSPSGRKTKSPVLSPKTPGHVLPKGLYATMYNGGRK